MSFNAIKFAAGIQDYLARALKPVGQRLKSIEDRLAALEAHGIKYVGVYQPSGDYERGHIVTHQGSAWHAVRPTRAVPGTSGDWQLMVKAGRDARGS